MKKTAMTLVALMLLIGLSALSTADHDAGDERSATFISSSHVEHDLNEACAEALGEDECVTRIPQGIIHTTCDYTDDSFDPAGLYDGRGGIAFCEIPKDTTVTLQFVNVIAATEPNARVTCPETEETGEDVVTWNTIFARLIGEAPTDVEVPDWCDDDSATGHEGHTSVNLFILTASLEQGGVYAPVEGEVTMQL